MKVKDLNSKHGYQWGFKQLQTDMVKWKSLQWCKNETFLEHSLLNPAITQGVPRYPCTLGILLLFPLEHHNSKGLHEVMPLTL
jgi:hypothetical protein